MRKIHVFVLRLVTNSDEPQRLRGAVRPLVDGEEHAFINGRCLLTLLRRMCQAPESRCAAPKNGGETLTESSDTQEVKHGKEK